MATFTPVALITDIPSGTMKTVHVSGKAIALANVDGSFFAIDDQCTHDHCSLSTEGFLDANVVICGCHGAQFDVTTGSVLSLPATVPEKTYEVKVEGNNIFIYV